MAEYTPTTEQVRRFWQYGANAWMEGLADDRDEGPDGSNGEVFDRWLAAHDREVAAKAWDEAAACLAPRILGEASAKPNPYREGGAS